MLKMGHLRYTWMLVLILFFLVRPPVSCSEDEPSSVLAAQPAPAENQAPTEYSPFAGMDRDSQ
jgi:hypothetical protein